MEFVERYRVLIPSLRMTEITDFKYTSKLICNRVLREEHDWQIGITKVFLKVCAYTCSYLLAMEMGIHHI